MDSVKLQHRQASSVNHLDRLYFLHIPKTAGTSVRAWIHQLFAETDLLPADHPPELAALDDDTVARHRFVSGHFGWHFMHRAAHANLVFEPITFLRNPGEALFSLLNFVGDASYVGATAPRFQRLRDMLAAGSFDHVVRRFNNKEFPSERDLADLPVELLPYWNMSVGFLAGDGTESSELPTLTYGDLAVAKARLRSMTFFGMANDMEWSTALFCAAFGLPLLDPPEHHNVGRGRRRSLPPALEMAFQHLNELDEELFRFAQSLFNRRVSDLKLTYGLSDEDGPVALAEPLRHRFLTTTHDVDLLRDGWLSQADGIVCTGFAPRFFWTDIDRWVRWSGKETTSTIYLPLDRSRGLKLRFEIAAVLTEDIRDGLRIQIDGIAVGTQSCYEETSSGSYRLYLECDVSPNERIATYTAVDFVVPRTERADGMSHATAFALADVVVTDHHA